MITDQVGQQVLLIKKYFFYVKEKFVLLYIRLSSMPKKLTDEEKQKRADAKAEEKRLKEENKQLKKQLKEAEKQAMKESMKQAREEARKVKKEKNKKRYFVSFEMTNILVREDRDEDDETDMRRAYSFLLNGGISETREFPNYQEAKDYVEFMKTY